MSSTGITFNGIASGLDTTSLIEAYVKAESIRKTQYEDSMAKWQNKLDLVDVIDDKIESVFTALENFKTASSFYSRSSSASDTSIAEVAADSTAQIGSYSVVVAGATKNIFASQGIADADTALTGTAGTFGYNDGNGKLISVNVNGDETLTELVDMLNVQAEAVGSSSRVSITDDGSVSRPLRMQIVGGAAGSGKDVSIASNSFAELNFGKGIDTAETIKWSTTNPDVVANTGGEYRGSVNKRFIMDVVKGGTIGSDEVEVRWRDSVAGKSGTITINAKDTEYEIAQGVKFSFTGDNNTLKKGDSFAIDVFAPEVQNAQDNGLAKAEKSVHFGHPDASTTPVTTSTGAFSYRFAGSETINVQVAANATLQDLVNAINRDGANPGVTASIVNDGLGSANSYHLALTSKKSGAGNTIEIMGHTLTNFAGDAADNYGFNVNQKGTNAMVKVNDYPLGDSYAQRSSNLVSDLISGASITIKSPGTTSITISNDVDDMVQKVSDFVTAYNDTMSYLQELTSVSTDASGQADTSKSGVFVGDYSIRTIQSKLQSLVIGQPAGFDGNIDTYSLLSQMGITTGDEKQLEFDADVLRDALKNNPEDVVDFFTADKKGITSSSYTSYVSGLSSTQAGKYNVRAKFDTDGKLTSAQYQDEDDGKWYDLKIGEENSATAMQGDARGMALRFSYDSSITAGDWQTSNVRIKTGKANQFYNDLKSFASGEEGITKVMAKNYENSISDLEDRIERETDRIADVETRLKKKFSDLEVAMQNYNSQSEQLQQQLSSLNSSV